MATAQPAGSRRRSELLSESYAYVMEHGMAGLSLRPLAAAAGTSPRVLLYLFGSKDQLVREILDRARREQLELITEAMRGDEPYAVLVHRLWTWLVDRRRRGAIRLFFEAYAISIQSDPGPWQGFAERSLRDWTAILVDAQPGVPREEARRRAIRTIALLRGLLLHLLAGGRPAELQRALEESL